MKILRYLTKSGIDVIGDWLARLPDARAKAKVVARLARLQAGNFGDCKLLREGVCELRIDWGPGYRVYYSMVDRACVLLLCGGDKRKQDSDINRAILYLHDYKRRTGAS